jgi:cytochrome c biogenesis protein CcdA
MLPAYLATGFRRRTGILAATLVFAAGVATVIVPIGLGATALVALVSGHHSLVFSLGGAAMLAGGVALLAGWKPQLPMLPGRAPTGHGFASVYGLGVFSGAASSCCAPVLAGVAVLSGAAGSFLAALAVSLTYVAGMVAPLCLLALVWDRRDWGATRLLHGRQVTLRLGRLRRRMPLGTAASGILLIAMGALTLVQAVTGPGMSLDGWRLRVAADLQHAASVATKALAWLPGWVLAAALLALGVFLVRQALAHLSAPARRSPPGAEAGAPDVRTEEEHVV